MSNLAKIILTTLVLFVIAITSATAQNFYNRKKERKVVITAGTGTASYYGEMANPGDYIDLSPNLSFGLQYQLLPRIRLGADITWYRLSGNDYEADDADLGFNGRRGRNLQFSSNNYEIIGYTVIDILESGRRFYERPLVSPYIYLGIGTTFFNPVATLDQAYTLPGTTETLEAGRYPLRPLMTEGERYNSFALVIPFGVGVRYRLTPYINIGVDGGYRFTTTDYLDDVSTEHFGNQEPLLAFSEFEEMGSRNALASVALSDRRWELPVEEGFGPNFRINEGAKRGNPDLSDGYFILNAKIEYFIPTISFGGKSPYGNRGGLFKNLFNSKNKRRRPPKTKRYKPRRR